MASSGGSTQLQTSKKLLPEPFLSFVWFLSCLTASGNQPLKFLPMVTPPLETFRWPWFHAWRPFIRNFAISVESITLCVGSMCCVSCMCMGAGIDEMVHSVQQVSPR